VQKNSRDKVNGWIEVSSKKIKGKMSLKVTIID
jgi:hypothetical protein